MHTERNERFVFGSILVERRFKERDNRNNNNSNSNKKKHMPILRGDGGGIDSFRQFMYMRGRDLYDEIKEIDVYRNHRESLRPWDRKLPLPVQAEANRRSAWTLNPPSTTEVALVWFFCISLLLLVGLIPFYSNFETMGFVWRDVHKPTVVYTNTNVLLAIWIIVHLCSATSLWFVYLTEGWAKHQAVLFFFALTILLDVMWIDVMFYTLRFDYNLGLWIAYLVFSVVTIGLMLYDRIAIGAMFLLPQMALSIVFIVYTVEFMKLHGTTLQNEKIQKPFW